jgi:prophage tail gpP-like protein
MHLNVLERRHILDPREPMRNYRTICRGIVRGDRSSTCNEVLSRLKISLNAANFNISVNTRTVRQPSMNLAEVEESMDQSNDRSQLQTLTMRITRKVPNRRTLSIQLASGDDIDILAHPLEGLGQVLSRVSDVYDLPLNLALLILDKQGIDESKHISRYGVDEHLDLKLTLVG